MSNSNQPAPGADDGTPETDAIYKSIRKAISGRTAWGPSVALAEAAKNGIESLERRLSAALAERDEARRELAKVTAERDALTQKPPTDRKEFY